MRNAFSLATLLVLAGTASAQPDPSQPPPDPNPAPAPTPTPTPAPTPPPPAPVRPVIDEPPPPPVEPKPEEPAAGKKLAVGTKGLFNPGMLAQFWYQLERSDGTSQVSQFRIRRAELSVNGEILPKRVGYRVMFDPARVLDTQKAVQVQDPMGATVVINNANKLSVLQDFYLTALSPYLELSVGQFKIPVSWEGYNSSGKIAFVERAPVSNAFGDKRDIGIRATKTFDKWMYSAGMFNGSGQDNPDGNAQKDLALRLEVYPVKGLTLAGVTYDSVGERDHAGTKDRWEADVRYEHGPYLVQSEVIFAQDVGKDGADPTKGHGFYALFGYSIPDVDKTFQGVLQPVVRVGAFDADTSKDDMAGDTRFFHYDVGVNYYLQKHEMKVQAAFSRQQFSDDARPANNELLLAAQVSY